MPRVLGSPSTPMVSSNRWPPLSPYVASPGMEPGVCSPARLSRVDCPHRSLSCLRSWSPGGIWGGWWEPSAPGAGSLVCVRRLPGRMALRSLMLLPFLLTAGEDFAQQLERVGRCWKCFQPPALV